MPGAVVARVEGLQETLGYLKRFEPELLKGMNKELYAVMKDLVKIGRSLAPTQSPMSGWAKPSPLGAEWGTRLLYQPGKVKTGIRSKIGWVRRKDTNTTERAYFLINANPAGAVYETAGQKVRSRTPQGRQFVRNIEQQSGIVVRGKQGRIAWKAVYDNRENVARAMKVVVDRYIDIINQKLAA